MNDAPAPIARLFATVDGRVVHLRWAGRGPALVLVHQSPRSSAEYEPLMARLAQRYTVIAPDTPGCGLSDPLPLDRPEIADFGDALARLLEVLGVARTLLYGFHTGAAIALAFAARHPRRVALAVLNGLPATPPAAMDALEAAYLPPFVPSWDGAHLVWLWSRLREQTIFYPWFDARAETRLAFTPPGAAALELSALEVLRAGDCYRLPYRAAFRAETQKLLASLRCPALVLQARWDPLWAEMETLTPPPGVERVRLGRDRDAHLAPLENALAAAAGTAERAPDPPPPDAAPARFTAAGLRVHITPGAGPPLVLLHDHHDDSNGREIKAAGEAAGARARITLDLPGHGETMAPWPEGGVRDAAALVRDALRELGLSAADVRGFGLGDRIAAALEDKALRHDRAGSRPAALGSDQHAQGARMLAAWAAPLDHGGHLLAAWRMARDGALFEPWCDPEPRAARRPLGDLAPEAIHQRAVAALKARPAWEAAWRALAPA